MNPQRLGLEGQQELQSHSPFFWKKKKKKWRKLSFSCHLFGVEQGMQQPLIE